MALNHVPEFAAFGGQRQQLLAADYVQCAVNERLHTIAVSSVSGPRRLGKFSQSRLPYGWT
jgi:hypothetical protein